jgi:hypothetical protein
MSKQVNYGDNLFFLQDMVRVLKNGLTLDIDSAYFLDKVVEDLLFIDTALSKIFAKLKENTHLIERNEYLRSLMLAKSSFSDLLEDLAESKIGRDFNLELFLEKFRKIITQHRQDINEIQDLLSTEEDSIHTGEVVSGEEIAFLLQDEIHDD